MVHNVVWHTCESRGCECKVNRGVTKPHTCQRRRRRRRQIKYSVALHWNRYTGSTTEERPLFNCSWPRNDKYCDPVQDRLSLPEQIERSRPLPVGAMDRGSRRTCRGVPVMYRRHVAGLRSEEYVTRGEEPGSRRVLRLRRGPRRLLQRLQSLQTGEQAAEAS